jgi:hypothetical protein
MPDLCYEYFDCPKKDCLNRKAKRLDCWNVAGDNCPHNIANKISIHAKKGCQKCLYRKHIAQIKNI